MSDDDDEARAGSGVWDASDPGHSELVQMRIRIIALENLVLAILAKSSSDVWKMVRTRAGEIQSRGDVAEQPLTRHASDEMLKLLARAERRASTRAAQ